MMQENMEITLNVLNALTAFKTNAYPNAQFWLPINNRGLDGCYDLQHLCGNQEAIQFFYLRHKPKLDATPEQRNARVRRFIDKNFREASNYDMLKYGFTYRNGNQKIDYPGIDPDGCKQYFDSLFPDEKVDPTIDAVDLYSLRKGYGLTQVAFANYLGMPSQTYIKWEVNERGVKPYLFEWLKTYCRQNPPEKSKSARI